LPPVNPTAEGTLVANGDDEGTYSLITGKGYAYESPDDDHSPPLRHIRQLYDFVLGKYVFAFDLHIDIDTDKGVDSDRQRNEIKTYSGSPASMVAAEGETLKMQWLFRLPEGMLTTTSFSHVHQLKGIDNDSGDADILQPLITFTARSTSGGEQKFQVQNVLPSLEGSTIVRLAEYDLSELLGEWLAVTEIATFSDSGTYSLEITRLSDNNTIISLDSIPARLWRSKTPGVRPKWGLYRSFGPSGNRFTSGLRDETLLFADFSITKL